MARRRDVLVLTAVAAGLCLYLADVLFLGRGFFFRDVITYAYPMKFVVRQALLSGEFPYWNPFYSAGEPLAANPAYQLYYPPQWLVLLPDFHLGVQLQILIHVVVGIAGTYVLLRVLGLGMASSAAGCVIFGFSGFFLGLVNLLWILFGFAWMPWILAFLHRMVVTRRTIWFVAAAIALALQILVGEPMTLVETVAVIAGYVVYRGWRHGVGRQFLREALLVAGVGVAALGLSAAQLIPAADFFPDTTRAQGFSYETSASWSMPPERLFELVYPSAFGSAGATRGLYWGFRAYPGKARPLLLSIYAGLLFAVLTIAGVVRRLRGSLLLIAAMVICYGVAIGSNGPVFEWLYRSGVFTTLRYPERFFVPALLAIVVFAAFAFQRVLDGDRRLIRTAAVVALIITVLATAAAATTHRTDSLGRFRRQWDLPDSPRATEMARLNQREWWIASIRGGLLAALLLWGMRGRSKPWLTTLWLYIVADLGIASHNLLPRMPQRFFTAPEIARELPAGRDRYRLFHLAAQMPRSPDAERYASLDEGAYWVVRNGLFPYTGALWGFRTAYEVSTDATKLQWAHQLNELLPRASQRRPGDWADRVSAFSNVRFVVYYRPFDAAFARAGGAIEKLRPVRFIESAFYPRYYFADRLVRVRNAADFIDQIIAPEYTYRTAGIFSEPFAPSGGRLLQVGETNNRVTLEVEASGPAYLVASNTFHKYWRATIDGRPVPVERTNFAFQGVRVAPGRHRVEFRYHNPLVIPAMIVSIVTLVVLGVIAVAGRRREGKLD